MNPYAVLGIGVLVVLVVAAVAGFLPLAFKGNGSTPATKPKEQREIIYRFDSQDANALAAANAIQLLIDGKFDLARKALDFAIAQRGPQA